MPTLIFTNGMTVVIIAVNFILKQLTIHLVIWIGYDTHSKVMTRITNGVILVLFFNTGILMTMTQANLSEMSSVLGTVFSGVYYDYSPAWYARVGNTLVHTMLANAFMPIIFESIANAMEWFQIGKDSGKWCGCGKAKNERFYSTK